MVVLELAEHYPADNVRDLVERARYGDGPGFYVTTMADFKAYALLHIMDFADRLIIQKFLADRSSRSPR
jgi:hypothetical protein